MKVILIIAGILIATAGGVIAYRALYIEPSAAVVITSTHIRELPNYTKVVGGILLLIVGAAMAFFSTRLKNSPR